MVRCEIANDFRAYINHNQSLDLCTNMYTVHKGVQKISKIVINRSILIIKYALERLDKKKTLLE